MTVFRVEPLGGDEDLDGVLAVEDASFTNPWTREMYQWELKNPERCRIYVVRSPSQPVVGFCSFWLIFDEMHINNVAVLPPYRGRGVGALLLTHVMTEAARAGARRATLEVRASNLPAQRLYEKYGFRPAGIRRRYYSDNNEDAIIMWTDRLRDRAVRDRLAKLKAALESEP